MGKYKICDYCHIAFDKRLKLCPSCNREIQDKKILQNSTKEGNGRIHHTGGKACDYCAYCCGDEHWCPIMDD